MSSELKTRFQLLHEFIPEAQNAMTPEAWGYLIGGTETETTVARNRAALDSIALRPRVLVDVSHVSATSIFFGNKCRLPVCLAPVGGLEVCHFDGALAAAQAAGEFGVPTFLSSVSPRSKTEVCQNTSNSVVFQLYVRGGKRFITNHVEEAITGGLDAFCITVDSAFYSRRERDIASRFVKPWRANVEGEEKQAQSSLNWEDIQWFRKQFDIPLILKGIMTLEDAKIAADFGVDAIYVSNHGGRQLDHGLGTMDVLPEIAKSVGHQCKVIVDGGFSRGTDIVKAIALGAHSVGLGRLPCYALAAAGPKGIVRMLEILEEEVLSALGLVGVNSFEELNPEHVQTKVPLVTRPHVHSAFPLLP